MPLFDDIRFLVLEACEDWRSGEIFFVEFADGGRKLVGFVTANEPPLNKN